MSVLTIELTGGKNIYRPGEEVSGRVAWSIMERPDALRISLIWFTSGRGTEDVEIIGEAEIDNPGGSGEHAFTFKLPLSPYSFSGQLISLTWAIEAVLSDPEEVTQKEIVVSPTGEEVVLRSTS